VDSQAYSENGIELPAWHQPSMSGCDTNQQRVGCSENRGLPQFNLFTAKNFSARLAIDEHLIRTASVHPCVANTINLNFGGVHLCGWRQSTSCGSLNGQTVGELGGARRYDGGAFRATLRRAWNWREAFGTVARPRFALVPSMGVPHRDDEQANDAKGNGGANDEAVGEIGVIDPEAEKWEFGLSKDQENERHD
jgi:hypothetical protein